MPPREIQIAERRRHQEVRAASAGDEVARDVLTVERVMALLFHTQHVLGGRRFVIDIERVNGGAVR